ncbi:MAG: sulfatase, partial [Armatimonadota bacterium]
SWAKHIYWGNLRSPMNAHNPEWTVEAALEFIEENKDRPFYLHYCTTLLHGGSNQWLRSLERPRVSGEGMLEKPPAVMPERATVLDRIRERGLDEQAAGYTWLDDSVGAVLRKLDELGIAENTLFVFITDHGSDFKASLYDRDGTSIPCIIRWPGHVQAGAVCDELVQNIDFVPTFFDVAEAEAPRSYQRDGMSLAPLFAGDKVEWRDHLYFEMGHARAVRTRDWKYIAVRYSAERIERIRGASLAQLPRTLGYIENLGLSSRGMTRNPNYLHYDQLYNLKNDPAEMTDLAGKPEHAERLKEMKERLLTSLRSFPDRPFGEFIPGRNAVGPGTIDDRIEDMKKVRVQGKEVTVIGEDAGESGRRRRGRR